MDGRHFLCLAALLSSSLFTSGRALLITVEGLGEVRCWTVAKSKDKFLALVLSRLSLELQWTLPSLDQGNRVGSLCRKVSCVDSVLLWAVTEMRGLERSLGGMGGGALR